MTWFTMSDGTKVNGQKGIERWNAANGSKGAVAAPVVNADKPTKDKTAPVRASVRD